MLESRPFLLGLYKGKEATLAAQIDRNLRADSGNDYRMDEVAGRDRGAGEFHGDFDGGNVASEEADALARQPIAQA